MFTKHHKKWAQAAATPVPPTPCRPPRGGGGEAPASRSTSTSPPPRGLFVVPGTPSWLSPPRPRGTRPRASFNINFPTAPLSARDGFHRQALRHYEAAAGRLGDAPGRHRPHHRRTGQVALEANPGQTDREIARAI